MVSSADLSAEDLKVFLQEADSLLELLDEEIIRLEQESTNDDLLQEIFRAAHTLKGSSGMLGFEQMAQLTHAMEDLLDRVRKGTQAVTAELVDALLMSLDGLKVLKNDLAAGEETTLQIDPLVNALRAAAEAAPDEAANMVSDGATLDSIVLGDPAIAARFDAATGVGLPVLLVSVEIEPESDWAAVRCFQVLNELDTEGEVIASAPSQDQIEQEQTSHSLRALVATQRSVDDVRKTVATIADVVAVDAAPWEGPSKEAAAEAVQDARAAPPASSQPALPDGSAKIEALAQSVRIDVEVLDALMNLVGELVIDRTRVGQVSRALASRYREDIEVRALNETSAHIARVVDELHQNMMQVRMLPVGVLFSKFPRLVRDLARSGGKKVSLVIEGDDTEIDRSVIDEIKDPLIHLIRNALDHGIETVEERAAAGKPETSVLKLSAKHAQGQILITLQDDGRGIDAGAVRRAAVRKGVLPVDVAERLSDSEAVELVFAPGLSTAKRTTEVSGRGVGMDIVRRNIEALNGRALVATESGVGTTFTLQLPLTLATFRGLLVDAGNTVYAIPLHYVQETVRPESGALWSVTGKQVMNLRGSVMSMLHLSEALGQSIATSPTSQSPDDPFVVVVKAGDSESDQPVAIVVDALIDQQEVVVKSLSGFLGRTRGISGASILGDGQVVLILDIPSLIKAAQSQQGSQDAPERTAS